MIEVMALAVSLHDKGKFGIINVSDLATGLVWLQGIKETWQPAYRFPRVRCNSCPFQPRDVGTPKGSFRQVS